MASSYVRGCLAVAALMALVGCSGGPRPVVEDFDTYQIVSMGGMRYVTPQGVRATEQHGGEVRHEIASLPGTVVVVRYDSHPPRSLRFDADAEKRRFLDEVPAGELTSVQYHTEGGREHVKVKAKGMEKGGDALFGAMVLVRETNRTATIRLVGPWAQRDAISRITDDMARRVELEGAASASSSTETGG